MKLCVCIVPYSTVPHLTCLTPATQAHMLKLLRGLCRHALPLLASSQTAQARAGGTLYLARLVHGLGPALAGHALLLVLPLLPCMSDPWAPIREAAAATFASLVALLPISLVSCSF